MVVSDGEREYNEKEVDELPSEWEDAEDENGFGIGDRLVAPNATMYTTAELHGAHISRSVYIYISTIWIYLSKGYIYLY